MTNLTPDRHQFMADNRPHYNTLVKADFLTNIGQPVKQGLLDIAQIFAPAYQANLWCGPCVCDLVKFAYLQYDKWIAEQPKEAETAHVIDEVKKRGRKPKVV